MSKASPGSLAAHLNDFALNTKGLRRFLARRLAAGRRARDLARLDDFMLKDIGLTRADIFSAVHGKVQRRD